ncbi:uncharacterized protein LOC129616470 [Condylostylus longicornis]|uniref:uncharacterized protein LOC129616470 n=1 Tax=Condylostylus longicornis TaxID=2530218 RepID=UPI00244E20DA|nr:uncharacterized protein LOC129616470 [Condylostylus longicornis]
MNFLDILPSIVFYYASVVIQGENCINLGLVSPIEVVEEWACHDTEVRLTCGHLDSKLAILEATFTPNCTNEDCLKLDIKRLAKAFFITSKPPVTISRKEETQAGRKFLEALKNGPRIPDENQEEVVVIDSSDTYTEIESGSSDSLENNLAGVITNQLNARKASLRASLEKLIIRYLRKLSPDENFDYEMHKRSIRYKRNMRRKRVKRLSKQNSTKNSKESIEELNISYDNDFDINFNDTDDQNTTKYDKMVLGKSHLRINLGEHFVVDENFGNKKLEYEQRQQKLKEIRLFCPDQKRKVSSLDRFDIENSYRNESMEDYNIRRLLNRRSS